MQAEVIQGTLEQPLTANDRCDGCGAQAYMRVTLAGGSVLLFCAHHGGSSKDKLLEIGAHIHDETQKLLAEEGVQIP